MAMNKKAQNNKKDRGARRGYKGKDTRSTDKTSASSTATGMPMPKSGSDNILMRDAASLSFYQTAGLPYEFQAPSGVTLTWNTWRNPGIMAFEVLPTPGSCGDWSSAVNVAIRDIYSFIRHANSGHANYDAADLGMYMLAYDSCLTYYAWMVRGYGLARTVLLKNRYTPEALVAACGMDYNDLVANLAQFRAYINTFAARLSALKVPASWHIMERHMALFSNVYVDAPVEKAQFYVFTPKAFWVYRTGQTPEETKLYPNDGFAWKCSYEVITSQGDYMLNALLNSEDFNIMSGDIIKAFGNDVFQVNMIAEDYAVAPIYDPDVLVQIHNATILSISDISTWSITQDYGESDNVGAVLFNATLDPNNATVRASAVSKILDLPVQDPTPDMVGMATRLMLQSDLAGNGKFEFTLTHCGSEIIVGVNMVQLGKTGFDRYIGWPPVHNYESFGSHPFIYDVQWPDKNVHTFSMGETKGTFDNYTVVHHDTLANIHRAYLMKQYGMVK